MPMRPQTILQAVGPLLIIAAGVAAFAWLQSLGIPPRTSPVTDSPQRSEPGCWDLLGSSSKFASAAGLSPVAR